ncbi:hypothetical protein EVAR_46709_1 [Eumeta japonica]|uniref:Uncharacterized protein n=1 Tax=Eumeta variegata TaxID=151549 RepID=A0A4C1X9L3_EUMVA|nr:hypothetical protein EVAR_46709_1 [Eumeta japonica]
MKQENQMCPYIEDMSKTCKGTIKVIICPGFQQVETVSDIRIERRNGEQNREPRQGPKLRTRRFETECQTGVRIHSTKPRPLRLINKIVEAMKCVICPVALPAACELHSAAAVKSNPSRRQSFIAFRNGCGACARHAPPDAGRLQCSTAAFGATEVFWYCLDATLWEMDVAVERIKDKLSESIFESNFVGHIL